MLIGNLTRVCWLRRGRCCRSCFGAPSYALVVELLVVITDNVVSWSRLRHKIAFLYQHVVISRCQTATARPSAKWDDIYEFSGI